MAKIQESRGEGGVCKKISRAVSFIPFTSHPNPRQVNDPPSGGKETSVLNDPHNRQKASRKDRKPFVQFGATKTGKFDTAGKESEGNNENFSNYIKKIKNKMVKPYVSKSNSKSNIGAAGRPSSATRRDSFNERVSEYINRMKMKIKTTSNVAGAGNKATSFKQ